MLVVILAVLQHVTKRIWLNVMYSTTNKENSPAQVLLKYIQQGEYEILICF